MIVRAARPADVDRLLELMTGLARFEGYFDDFAVTRDSVLAGGFGDAPIFKAFVAEVEGTVIGMAVTYVVPWTYTLRPRLVLKELFINEGHRDAGAGRALFAAVAEHARHLGAGEIAWTVTNGNSKAEAFYRSVGGKPDVKWQNWTSGAGGYEDKC
ncbi:N-acetyltransferase family protein [Roseibium sp.]|uniref:GNAT family N-acetyltransferase n=1 Tax=Roseibium sp. TaxID=1936156 RepID=UPI003D0E8290